MRKLLPYLLFAGLGLLMLFGHGALLAVTSFINGAPTAAAGPAVSSAAIAADQQAGGWVQAGVVTSKLITAGGAYLFFVILLWWTQRLTHPAPTKWAKTRYSAAFDALPADGQRFDIYGRIRLQHIILAAAALVFAALVV